MSKVRFICLANSWKRGGRCVAGLCTDKRCWIRPISGLDDGTLKQYEYIMSNGAEAALLDEIEVEVIAPKPAPHQPENWLLGSSKWQLVRHIPSALAIVHLLPFIDSSLSLLGNQSDCIPHEYFLQQSAQASLVLIEPETIEWSITPNPFNNRRKARCIFRFGGIDYDLAITDPIFVQQLEKLQDGRFCRNIDGIGSGDRIILTVSLGEPFQDKCYKLVAAVLVLPK